MSRLTRDGTAEPVSRDQILRHAPGQGNIIFAVQLTTSRIGNLTRLIRTLLYVMAIHTYIHSKKVHKDIMMYVCIYSHTYSKSMDQPGKVASPARGQLNRENGYFPVRVRARELTVVLTVEGLQK